MKPERFKPHTSFHQSFILVLLALALGACEDVIDINLDQGTTQLAVDAWLTDQPGPQTIRLTQTAPYFGGTVPPPATGATVTVTDDKGKTYAFQDARGDGNYTYLPAKGDTFGRIGRRYALSIRYGGQQYGSISEMRRVPAIDSITFVKRKLTPVSQEEGYEAEFYATDLPGARDYYWIRTYHNGKRDVRPQSIITSLDGGFNGAANTDGLLFIRPIRQSANIEKLYQLNDSVRVELWSIMPEAFFFFQQLATQVNNAGLFATPPTNVPTNIRNLNTSGPKAVGFFGVAAVSAIAVRVEEKYIRKAN